MQGKGGPEEVLQWKLGMVAGKVNLGQTVKESEKCLERMGRINKTWWVGEGWKMISLVLYKQNTRCLYAIMKGYLEVQQVGKRKLKGNWYSG